jgi:hypothetical protein
MHHAVHINIVMLMVIVVFITVVVVAVAVGLDMPIVFLLVLILILLSDRSIGRRAVFGGGPRLRHRNIGSGGGPLEARMREVGEWRRRWRGGAGDGSCGRAWRSRDRCRRRSGGGHQARVGRLALGEIG